MQHNPSLRFTSTRQIMTDQRLLLQLDASDFDHMDHTRAACCVEPAADAVKTNLIYFEYFNKGAANVIFKIHPWTPTSPSPNKPFQLLGNIQLVDGKRYTGSPLPLQAVSNKVLRVPRGKAKCLSGEDIIKGFEGTIRPLFEPKNGKSNIASVAEPASAASPQVALSTHLMNHDAVVLLPSVMEHFVAITEKGTFESMKSAQGPQSLTHRRWGMFLPDMSSTPNASVTLEIKPKWLVQSPNAPKSAIRCRTCAMQIHSPKSRDTYICPLRLVNGNEHDLCMWMQTTVAHLLSGKAKISEHPPPQSAVESVRDHILEYITKGDGRILLQHLRRLQKQLDPHGVLSRDRCKPLDKFDHDLRAAMTLRDCSFFIKLSYTTDGAISPHITSKLGDLDFKSAEKIEDWAQKEMTLLRYELYTEKIPNDDLTCWVTRGGGSPNSV